MRSVFLVLVVLSVFGVGCNQGAAEREQLTATINKLEAEKARLEVELQQLRAKKEGVANKSLADKLLGDWGKTGPTVVRGLSIKQDGTATVSFTPGQRKDLKARPPMVTGKYVLAGNVLQITDHDNDKAVYSFEIVSVSNDELAIELEGFHSAGPNVLKRY